MFLTHERVYIGNDINTSPSIGTVYYRTDGRFQVIDIEGIPFKTGDVITGEDSGYIDAIRDFNYEERVEPGTPWDLTYVLVADDYQDSNAERIIYVRVDPEEKASDEWQQDKLITVIDTYVPPLPYTINTSNTLMQSGDYIVINAWFTNGANTDTSNIYQYAVVI